MAIANRTPIGAKFHFLTVIGFPVIGKHWQKKVLCRCDCGIEKMINVSNLISDHTKSCGCLKNKQTNLKHGHAIAGRVNRTYAIYRDMRTRCENQNYREFHLYGGRGISVCDRWREGYENFLADMGERPPGMTLDRINVDQGYSPENCRWATPHEQALNRRSNVFIEYQGERLTVSQWADRLGLNAKRMYYGVKKGWPTEKILSLK